MFTIACLDYWSILGRSSQESSTRVLAKNIVSYLDVGLGFWHWILVSEGVTYLNTIANIKLYLVTFSQMRVSTVESTYTSLPFGFARSVFIGANRPGYKHMLVRANRSAFVRNVLGAKCIVGETSCYRWYLCRRYADGLYPVKKKKLILTFI